MKKITAFILSLGLLVTTSYAHAFPEPDWGALLSNRRSMVTERDFELYVEGGESSAPYYGARLEPRAGAYIGTVAEHAEEFFPASSHLTYIDYDSRQSDLYYPSNDFVRNNDMVTMVGWNTTSIDNIDYDYIRRTLDTLNGYNKPMIIRFANEMNVSNLGDNPDKYIEVFKNVANMIHEYPNFAVVWSPNDMGALDRPFQYYYPGDEYVDWIGVSCYMTKYFLNAQNTSEKDSIYFMTGSYAWATNKIKPVMEFLSRYNINKPVMISEGGVERSDSRGEDFSGWHEPRLRNMMWYLVMKYPQIKMINYFNTNYHGEALGYGISDYPESVSIFKEAESSGAYMRQAGQNLEFVFGPANDGATLTAKNGLVKLYTLAYFANNPDITVNYKIDGVWFHSSNQIPYICRFDINSITDGAHTMTIEANGASKSYTLYKRGQLMSFGSEPDMSMQPAAENTISVNVNGNVLSFEQPPVIINDRTLVPMRAIFESLGAEVEWIASEQTARAYKDGVTVNMQIGNNTMYKNSQAVTLDASAQIINDYTMVPVRAIAEAFGADVSWDNETRTVYVLD